MHRILVLIAGFSLSGFSMLALAEQSYGFVLPAVDNSPPSQKPAKKLMASFSLHSKSEMAAFLERAEAYVEQAVENPEFEPIEMVLHGSEVNLFLRKNYALNKELINKAARLDAFRVINIQVCETWMRYSGESLEQLPAFVESVPYGPAVEKELLSEGYIYF